MLIAIFSRALRGEASRKPVFVFIDELHNFVGPALAKMISSMLAETRKFNTFFVLMTQYPKQLPKELRAATYELTDIYCFKILVMFLDLG